MENNQNISFNYHDPFGSADELDAALNDLTSGEDQKEKSEQEQETSPPANPSTQETLYSQEELDEALQRELKDEGEEKPPKVKQEGEQADQEQQGEDTDETPPLPKDEEQKDAPDAAEDEDASQFRGEDLLEVLREEGLLYIPDDFDGELTEEKLDELKEQTLLMQEQALIDNIRARFQGDPYKEALLEYAFTAPQDADLPRFSEALHQVRDYSSMNLDEETTQRELLTEYYLEGLDPNLPTYELHLNNAQKQVDALMGEDDVLDKVKEAQEFFVQKNAQILQEEQQRVAQVEQQRQQMEYQRLEQEQQWHTNFQQSLAKKQWAQDKKQNIFEHQYGSIDMPDGNVAPLWYAKELAIKTDPLLYQEYLDFLSGFDLKTRQFKQSGSAKNIPNQVNKRKLLALAQRKAATAKAPSRTPQVKRDTAFKPNEDFELFD